MQSPQILSETFAALGDATRLAILSRLASEGDMTVQEVARQLSAAAVTALATPEVKEKLLAIGLIPVGSTPEALTQELAANTAFWQPIVKATGYKIAD